MTQKVKPEKDENYGSETNRMTVPAPINSRIANEFDLRALGKDSGGPSSGVASPFCV